MNGTGSIVATDVAVGNPGLLYTLNVTARDNRGKGLVTREQANVKVFQSSIISNCKLYIKFSW